MLVRKLVTTLKWITLRLKKVSIVWSLKNNLEFNVSIYNSGKKLSIGRTYIRNNTLINTEDNGELIIGDDTFFNRNCVISCRKKIRIGDNCIFGPNVCVYDHDHKHDSNGISKGYVCDDVIIEDGCWIGAGVIILRGTHIGKDSIVAAGSVVKGNYPEKTLIYSVNDIKTRTLG